MLSKIQGKFARALKKIGAEIDYQISLLKHFKELPQLDTFEQRVIQTLRREGAFVTSLEELELSSTSELLTAAKSHLQRMDLYVASQRSDRQLIGTEADPAYPQIFTVTDLPEFSAWGKEERLLKIVESYIGLPVTFQGVHLRKDFANEKPVTTEFWHQDMEDRRIIKIFVYLSDVSEVNGPFEYIPKTKASFWSSLWIRRTIAKTKSLGIDDATLARFLPKSALRACPGPAGTAVLADTSAIFHHGKTRVEERSALFFVYTSAKPLRPQCCTQYHDRTYARPDYDLTSQDIALEEVASQEVASETISAA
jgi:hypothetical protein